MGPSGATVGAPPPPNFGGRPPAGPGPWTVIAPRQVVPAHVGDVPGQQEEVVVVGDVVGVQVGDEDRVQLPELQPGPQVLGDRGATAVDDVHLPVDDQGGGDARAIGDHRRSGLRAEQHQTELRITDRLVGVRDSSRISRSLRRGASRQPHQRCPTETAEEQPAVQRNGRAAAGSRPGRGPARHAHDSHPSTHLAADQLRSTRSWHESPLDLRTHFVWVVRFVVSIAPNCPRTASPPSTNPRNRTTR